MPISEGNKYAAFDQLCGTVQLCKKCPRMKGSARVLNRGAGSLNAIIMFIGEAPGRFGADASELPFHGDQAGHNFEQLLEFAGLSRPQVYITNAVLCNPKDDKGNNSTPNSDELGNCAQHLKRQIDLVNPRIVVTLGAFALKALSIIDTHKLQLSTAVRTVNNWYRRTLIPLYHPGQRAMLHRSFANQRSDYQFVAERLARLERRTPVVRGSTKLDVASVARVVISEVPNVSYFALHKLFYLVELAYASQNGERLTRAFFIRQKDGPYCVDLHYQKLRKALPDLEFDARHAKLRLGGNQRVLFDQSGTPTLEFPKRVTAVVSPILAKYGSLSDTELKTKVYLTTPMRRILREEQKSHRNLYNTPIEFF